MNVNLGLRAVALLAFVAMTTVAIVKPDLIGGPALAAMALHHL